MATKYTASLLPIRMIPTSVLCQELSPKLKSKLSFANTLTVYLNSGISIRN
jgi:hypothetical protein